MEWLWESMKPGKRVLAVEIDALGVGRDGLRYFGKVTDGDDLVSANGDCFRVGILRVGGEDFGVKENAVGGVLLGCQG